MSTLYAASLCGFAFIMLMLILDGLISTPHESDWGPKHLPDGLRRTADRLAGSAAETAF